MNLEKYSYDNLLSTWQPSDMRLPILPPNIPLLCFRILIHRVTTPVMMILALKKAPMKNKDMFSWADWSLNNGQTVLASWMYGSTAAAVVALQVTTPSRQVGPLLHLITEIHQIQSNTTSEAARCHRLWTCSINCYASACSSCK